MKSHVTNKKLGTLDFAEACRLGALRLLPAAREHAYDALLVTGAPDGVAAELLAVASAVGTLIPGGWSDDGRSSDLIYSVEVNEQAHSCIREETGYRMATKLSEGMYCHTDGFGLGDRPDHVMLQCVRPSSVGGRTTLVFLDDIESRLTAENRDLLGRPIWPSERGLIPVLQIDAAAHTRGALEFNAQYIRSHLKKRPTLGTAALLAALGQLESLCHWSFAPCSFRMLSGEILIIDNRRVLHGRQPFSRLSERLLRRAWLKT